jgi:hypothetical protein
MQNPGCGFAYDTKELVDSYTEDRTRAFERKWTLAIMGERAQLGIVGAKIAIF